MTYSSLSAEVLVRACAQPGDPAAWEEFVRRFHRLVATVAMRTAARWGETARQVIDDLVQETYLKLCADGCRLLREFESRHPDAIYGYLKVVTANVVHDHFKALHTVKRGAGLANQETEPMDTRAGGEHTGSPETIEREILLREIEGYLRACVAGPSQERDRRIFWLYYRHGLSARAIASLPSVGLSTKGVESTLLRLTRGIRSEIGERRADENLSRGRGVEKGIEPAESF